MSPNCSGECICLEMPNINDSQGVVKEVIGIIATTLTGITLIPQIVIAIKTKGEKTMDIPFLFITFSATIFWIIYGYLLGSIQTVILEVIVFFNVIILSICKFVYWCKTKRHLENNVPEEQNEAEIEEII